ncbi:hypothetical protein DUGA2_27570 [Duganella sp. HH101]|nr:hypothetical protein DUGA2_27570 [Duganella sp. HH101]
MAELLKKLKYTGGNCIGFLKGNLRNSTAFRPSNLKCSSDMKVHMSNRLTRRNSIILPNGNSRSAIGLINCCRNLSDHFH